MSRAREARRLVRTHRSGVLSTHSLKVPGYPYGSALPHVTDQAGRVLFLISHLAEHTHNCEADPRASFIVSTSGPELQSAPRVTLVGDVRPRDDEALLQRYLRFYPAHKEYLQIGGFRLYSLDPVQARYIEGFGGLHWLPGETYLAAPGSLPEAEASMLAHMNADHRDALRDCCRHFFGVVAPTPELIGVDCDGLDIRSEGQLLRFDFAEPVGSPGQVRSALVAMAQACRR